MMLDALRYLLSSIWYMVYGIWHASVEVPWGICCEIARRKGEENYWGTLLDSVCSWLDLALENT